MGPKRLDLLNSLWCESGNRLGIGEVEIASRQEMHFGQNNHR